MITVLNAADAINAENNGELPPFGERWLPCSEAGLRSGSQHPRSPPCRREPYYVGTAGHVSAETIKKYIEEVKNRGRNSSTG